MIETARRTTMRLAALVAALTLAFSGASEAGAVMHHAHNAHKHAHHAHNGNVGSSQHFNAVFVDLDNQTGG